eukprot:Gregarina_sp_Poly_1__1638@NODE_1418_length_4190_cov_186_181421_g945_i0_p1_GENE_NODE_1418_length_4190_cov_186_181421_g945_i0NODE_1418_length_4190_cov_186_181421_g945_i0_p1_ORF_typecomplete_len1093_score142_13Acyltransferase/PF01553_21/3e16NAD_binding_4/PF07993_12/0_04NAD_binding_4/PF07993_12/3_8e03Trans_reg_C/PF00486_28/0_17_NODE_1418_length_4190_cov_186_181421_g945_i02963574
MDKTCLITDIECAMGRELVCLLSRNHPLVKIVTLGNDIEQPVLSQYTLRATVEKETPGEPSFDNDIQIPRISMINRKWWLQQDMLDVEIVFLCGIDGYTDCGLFEPAVSSVLLRNNVIVDGLLELRKSQSSCRLQRIIVQSTLLADDFAKTNVSGHVRIFECASKGRKLQLKSLRHYIRASSAGRSIYSNEATPSRTVGSAQLMNTNFATWHAYCYNELEALVHSKLSNSGIEVAIVRLPLLTKPVFASGPAAHCSGMCYNLEEQLHQELPDIRMLAKRILTASPVHLCPIDYAASVLICLAEWSGIPTALLEPRCPKASKIRARIEHLSNRGFPVLHLDRCLHMISWPTDWSELQGPIATVDWPPHVLSLFGYLLHFISWLLLLIASPAINIPNKPTQTAIGLKCFRPTLTYDCSILNAILQHFDDRLNPYALVSFDHYLLGTMTRRDWQTNNMDRFMTINVLDRFKAHSMRKLAAAYENTLEETQKRIVQSVLGEIRPPNVSGKLKALNWMSSDFATSSYIVFGCISNFILRRVFPQIQIDMQSLQRLTRFSILARESNTPVLLLPSHQSYFDFVVLSYTCLAFGLQIPMVAADESFSCIPLIAPALKSSGAFFLRRNQKCSEAEREVLTLFFRTALQHHRWIQFFIEGGRSRTGYIGRPRKGLLSQGLHALIVPVRVCYLTCPEFESMSSELLGHDKTAESFQRFFSSALFHEKQNDIAQIRVGDSVTVSSLAALNQVSNSSVSVTQMAWHITFRLQDLHLVSFHSLLASILLESRANEWDVDRLEQDFKIRRQYIGSHRFLEFQEDNFWPTLTTLFSKDTPFSQNYELLLDATPLSVSPTVSTIPSVEDSGVPMFDQAETSSSCRMICLRARQHESNAVRNVLSNQLNYFRFGLWDVLGVDTMIATAMLDRFRLEKSDKVLISRVKILGECISGLVWGERVTQMSQQELQTHVTRLRRDAEKNPDILIWLRSIFIPLINGLKLLLSELLRLYEEGPRPVGCGDFIKQCRQMAVTQMWPLGCFPLIDGDLIRSALKLSGYVPKSANGSIVIDVPKTVPFQDLNPSKMRDALQDISQRTALDGKNLHPGI